MTQLRVVYEEDRLVAADKPSGMSSEEVAAALGLKLVHRIDKGTSGLLLLATDARAVQRMQRLLVQGGLERSYWLVAHGHLGDRSFESALVRDRGDGLRGSARDGSGKLARTTLRVLARTERTTIAEAQLHTGRTHQIRIHLAEAGHPLVGETVYVRDYLAAGNVLEPAPRLWLHAWRLRFLHPMAKRAVALESAPPRLSE